MMIVYAELALNLPCLQKCNIVRPNLFDRKTLQIRKRHSFSFIFALTPKNFCGIHEKRPPRAKYLIRIKIQPNFIQRKFESLCHFVPTTKTTTTYVHRLFALKYGIKLEIVIKHKFI